MTRESSLWGAFKDALPPDAHAVRVENEIGLGTPDVNLGLRFKNVPRTGQEYWIELKVQDSPKRAATKFRCDHFTMDQKQWLVDRTRAGGNAYMLLQIPGGTKGYLLKRDYYLWLRGDVAAVWIDHCSTQELIDKAEWAGQHLSELVDYLTR